MLLLHLLLTLDSFYDQLANFRTFFNTFQSAIAGAERVFEMIEEEEEVKDVPNAITKDKFEGNVVFRNVKFQYLLSNKEITKH